MNALDYLKDLQVIFNDRARIAYWDIAPIAGEFDYAELWNDALSGVVLLVTSITVHTTTTGLIIFGSIGARTAPTLGLSVNKNLGGVVAVDRLWFGRSATPPGFTSAGILLCANRQLMLVPPVYVPPGKGLHFKHTESYVKFSGHVEYLELII
jgi:hypothetical protein